MVLSGAPILNGTVGVTHLGLSKRISSIGRLFFILNVILAMGARVILERIRTKGPEDGRPQFRYPFSFAGPGEYYEKAGLKESRFFLSGSGRCSKDWARLS